MQNFDDLDIEGRNPSHLSEEERERDEYDRKRLMRSSVTAEDGTLRPVYSLTDDDDIWCHICNISLFGKQKLLSHNSCNRHKMKLDECPYSVSLWSNRSDASKSGGRNNAIPAVGSMPSTDALAPGEPVPPGMEDQLTRSTTIQVSLDRHRTSPLVGLEYIFELVDNESCEPSYTCVLCDKRGDPRTVMSHIASYNHRITYLNRHFPTVSRAITELPRTANYKRGAYEITVLVAKKIEEVFGRLQPQLVDKYQFEKNKMQYIKRVYEDHHFRERPDRTFMEVYDVRWVTNFDEMMAEVSGTTKKEDARQKQQHLYQYNENPLESIEAEESAKRGDKDRFSKKIGAKEKEKLAKREDAQVRYNKMQHSYQHNDNPATRIEAEDSAKKEEKRADKERLPKKNETKDKEKPVYKIRILTKEKLNTRNAEKREDKPIKPAVRPSDDTKSLSSLSSISSSPSPTRSRPRSRERDYQCGNRSTAAGGGSADRHKYRAGGGGGGGGRSRSIEPWRERDKWEKYRKVISRAEETLLRALKFHEKNPEKHPSYPDEWKKFWNRRYKELQADGQDPSKHDFKPEWIEFWNKRMREIHAEQLQQRKEEMRKRLELPEERVSKKTDKLEKSSDKVDVGEKSAERAEKRSTGRDASRERHELSPAVSVKRTRRHVESDDDIEYVGTTKTIKTTEYIERVEPPPRERDYGYTYTRGRAGIYRTSNYYPPSREPRPRHYATSYMQEKSPSPPAAGVMREDLEIVGLLRLLTALEGQLGSLGPKIVTLLSKALAAEKAQPNSAEDLLHDEDVCVLFETVKEKLKGQLFAGMIEKVAVAPTKSAIQNIAKLMHKAAETKKKLELLLKHQLQDEEERRKRCQIELTRPLLASLATANSITQRVNDASKLRSEPVSVPGVGAVDKVAIAQQIAAALIAQGRTNVSQAELETLINAVVGMAEASQHSDKPITAASFVRGLTAASRAGESSSVPIKVSETSSSTAATIALSAIAAKVSSAEPPTSQSRRDEERESSSSQRRDASPNNRRESLPRETSIQRDSKERTKSARMESLSDNDLKTLLQNFKDLGTDEQHALINFLKKLEATDLARVEKLRGYVNLGTPASHSSSSATATTTTASSTAATTSTKKAEATPSTAEAQHRAGQGTKSGRSMSPFSTRKGNQNPADDESKWKPKLDMFADDEDEPERRKQEQSHEQKLQHQQSQESAKRSKTTRVEVDDPDDNDDDDDDDDDYSFEDIYKAADKNVSESERARRKRSSRSRSKSSRSWSRSRSGTPPPQSRISPTAKSRNTDGNNDPNAILNETKRLIANIMGDLPNKYVVKSHTIAKSANTSEAANTRASIPQLPVPQQNLYGSNYPSTNNSLQQQQQAMSYQQMGNHQFAGYQQQQQQNSFNPNAGGYMNNGYNYNQSYGNMGGGMMPSNQGQSYGAAGMQTGQYGAQQQSQSSQQMYGMGSQYGGPNTGPPVGYPQQQYGNYQQQRFY